MKSPIKILTSIGVIALMQIAHAEGGCPEGMAPYAVQNQGGNVFNCTPIPGYNQQSQPQQPPPPPVKWADRWGTLVIGGETDKPAIFGVSSNMENKSSAETLAINKCKALGGGDTCKVGMTYHNQCIALAEGETVGLGVAGGVNSNEAKTTALSLCNQKYKNCDIVYSQCSMPVRIQ